MSEELDNNEVRRLFPGLFEVIGPNKYRFVDSVISEDIYECVPRLMITEKRGYNFYPMGMNHDQIVYDHVILSFTIVDGELGMGYLQLKPGQILPEEISAKVFNYGFNNICYLFDGKIVYQDREAIMRRNAIKNIINHE